MTTYSFATNVQQGAYYGCLLRLFYPAHRSVGYCYNNMHTTGCHTYYWSGSSPTCNPDTVLSRYNQQMCRSRLRRHQMTKPYSAIRSPAYSLRARLVTHQDRYLSAQRISYIPIIPERQAVSGNQI